MTLALVLQQMSIKPWMGESSGSVPPVVMTAVCVIGAVKEIRDGVEG